MIVGEAFVEISPDSSDFRGQADRDVKKATKGVTAKVRIEADATGLRRQVKEEADKAALGQKVKVPVEGDSSGAEKRVEALGKEQDSLRATEAEYRKLAAESEAGSRRQANATRLADDALKRLNKSLGDVNRTESQHEGIGDDVDRDNDSIQRFTVAAFASARGGDDFNQTLTKLRNIFFLVAGVATVAKVALGSIKFVAMAAAAGLATAALGTLVAMLFSVVGALGPLTGLIPAFASGLLAIGQGAGVAIGAFQGVSAALKGYAASQKAAATEAQKGGAAALAAGRQAEQAALAVESADRQVASAERQLARVQEESLRAVESLADARRAAAEELEDQVLRAAGAALSVERAQVNLTKAQERALAVDQDWEATAGDRADAALAIREAELDLRQATEERGDEDERLNKLQRDGVEGSDQVVAANREIAATQENARAAAEDYQVAAATLGRALRDASEQSSGAAGATDEFALAMDKLSPAAQSFVRTLISFQAPLLELRDVAAANMFPGLERGLAAVRPLFDVLRPIVADTATVIGQFGEKLGTLLGGPFFTGQFAAIGQGNVGIIKAMGDGFLNWLPGLTQLTAASQPLVLQLVQLGQQAGEVFSRFIEAKSASGELATFFQHTFEVVKQLGSILFDLGSILFGIGKAGSEVGRGLLNDIGGGLDGLAKKINSGEGQAAISGFFDRMKPVFDAVLVLFETFGKSIIDILVTVGPALAPLIQAVSALLPALTPLINILAVGLAGAIAAVGPPLTRLVEALAGPFQSVINSIVPVVPVLANAFADLVIALAPSIVEVIDALAGIMEELLPLLAPSAPIIAELAKAFLGLAEPAVELVKAFLPVLGIIGKLVAQFASALAPVLAKIATALKPVVELLGEQLGRVFKALEPVLPDLADAFAQVGLALVQLLPALIPLIPAVADLLIALIPLLPPLIDLATLWVRLVGVLTPLIALLAELVAVVVGAVAGAIKFVIGIFEDFGGTLDTIGQAIEDVAGFLLDLADKAVEGVGKLVGLIAEIPGKIEDQLSAIGGAALRIGEAIFDNIVDAVRGIPDAVIGAVKGAVNGLIGLINNFLRFVHDNLKIDIGGGSFLGQDIPELKIGVPLIQIPELASGAIVRARGGGTLARIGEGGRDEAVIPLPHGLVEGLERIASGADRQERLVQQEVIQQLASQVARLSQALATGPAPIGSIQVSGATVEGAVATAYEVIRRARSEQYARTGR